MRMLLLLIPTLAYCFCFEDAGRYYGVSPHLLWAIAKVGKRFQPKGNKPQQKRNLRYRPYADKLLMASLPKKARNRPIFTLGTLL